MGYVYFYIKVLNESFVVLIVGLFVVSYFMLIKDDKYVYYKVNVKYSGMYEIYWVNVEML